MASTEHQKMVQKIIDEFKSKGLTITCADHEDYDTCGKTDGYIPDVRAKNPESGLNYIGESETCDSVSIEHTKEQIKAFSNRKMSGGKSKGENVPFYIAVPKECHDELEEVLKELGLSDNVTRWNYN